MKDFFSTSEENDFKDYVVDNGILYEAIDWVRNNLIPEDVFSEEDLNQWALDNDYCRNPDE